MTILFKKNDLVLVLQCTGEALHPQLLYKILVNYLPDITQVKFALMQHICLLSQQPSMTPCFLIYGMDICPYLCASSVHNQDPTTKPSALSESSKTVTHHPCRFFFLYSPILSMMQIVNLFRFIYTPFLHEIKNSSVHLYLMFRAMTEPVCDVACILRMYEGCIIIYASVFIALVYADACVIIVYNN